MSSTEHSTTNPTSMSTTMTASFQPGPDWILLSQGAEARVWKVPHNHHPDNPNRMVPAAVAADPEGGESHRWVICKERFSKTYRHRDLDERLNKQRCRMEARLLTKCAAAATTTTTGGDDMGGVRVPRVWKVEPARQYPEPALLYLEYLEGYTTVRDYLEDTLLVAVLPRADAENDTVAATNDTAAAVEVAAVLHQLAQDLGSIIARLHAAGMIHGDLTTSNIMICHGSDTKSKDDSSTSSYGYSNMTLIDFGLAKNTTSAEERAVDLYVLERALQSTHPALPTTFWETALQTYATTTTTRNEEQSSTSSKGKQDTLSRLEQVRLRGRKRECFG